MNSSTEDPQISVLLKTGAILTRIWDPTASGPKVHRMQLHLGHREKRGHVWISVSKGLLVHPCCCELNSSVFIRPLEVNVCIQDGPGVQPMRSESTGLSCSVCLDQNTDTALPSYAVELDGVPEGSSFQFALTPDFPGGKWQWRGTGMSAF